MNRRSAVRNLALVTGGWISLPFWMTACRMSDKNTHFSSFSPEEQQTLSSVVDAIIPAGHYDAASHSMGSALAGTCGYDGKDPASGSVCVGALSVGIDKFLQKLIDDCYEKSVQDNVKKQLAALDTAAESAYGKSFAACTPQQKEALLNKKLLSTNKDEKDCFVLLKNETIRGFNTSQQVMEGFLNYKVAPGHYYGCVTIKS